jgi:hypothetical protein
LTCQWPTTRSYIQKKSQLPEIRRFAILEQWWPTYLSHGTLRVNPEQHTIHAVLKIFGGTRVRHHCLRKSKAQVSQNLLPEEINRIQNLLSLLSLIHENNRINSHPLPKKRIQVINP